MTNEDKAVRSRCTRFLSHHHAPAPATMLQALAAHPAAAAPADAYGEGGAVADLERRVAALLGKEAALFFIKGVTAQLSTLSAYAVERNRRTIALHRLSHPELDEQNALERAAHLVAVRLGRDTPFTVEALEQVAEPLAAVVVELPLRRAGYLLPDLPALRAISAWCRARGVPLHVDGARLWESAAGYGIPLAEIAALADSVYVSFYKGLGGLGGAAVAGPAAFLPALKAWKTRYGGDLYTAYPQAISAIAGLNAELPRMPEYVMRARALAERLSGVPEVLLQPARPHVNAFQLWIRGDPLRLATCHRAFAEEHGVWLVNAFQPAPLDGFAVAEVVIGNASDDYTPEEAADWVRSFVRSCADQAG